MNETSKLRESIRGRTDTFVASDFDTDKAVGILNKMRVEGEIEVAGYDKGVSGQPVKRYKVVKLREFSAKRRCADIRKDMVSEKPMYVQLWSRVYPDLFRVPDFSGYKQTVRRFVGC